MALKAVHATRSTFHGAWSRENLVITQLEFDSLIPGTIVVAWDSFALQGARATVVSRDPRGLELSFESRGGGRSCCYDRNHILSVEFDMDLVRDFVKNVSECARCESCADAAKAVLAYLDVHAWKRK